MSLLLLVRHGQASFLADDYDQLSEKGQEQARILGRFWSERGFCPSLVVVGPCRRHEQTWQGILEGLAPDKTPEVQHLKDWDEYDSIALMKKVLPGLMETDPELKEYAETYEKEPAKSFQKMFEIVTKRWIREELDVEGVEPWAVFRSRVQRGWKELVAGAERGSTIAVVTSAGPVASVMADVLGLSEELALSLSWQVYNASVTEFLFSSNQISLSRFNTTPHFSEKKWVTYR